MDKVSRLKKELRDLLAHNGTKPLLDQIGSLCNENSNLQNGFINLISRYRENNYAYNIEGRIDYKDFKLELNSINSGAITLIDEIENEDLVTNWNLLRAIKDKILIYSEDTTVVDIESVFDPIIFPGVRFADDLTSLPEPKKWQLIIYSMAHYEQRVDNKSEFNDLEGPIKKAFKRLDNLVENTDYHIVYFGNYYFMLEESAWRKRVHAANSPISLLARVQEMLDYLEKIGKRML